MSHDQTIFIIDDNAEVRASVEFLAASMRAKCKSYESAEAFLAGYQGERGCVISDVRMPGMTGLELQDALIARRIHLPLILMTAYADVGIAVKTMKKGAVSLLEKPCRDSDLWDEIRRSLELDRQLHETEARLAKTRAALAALTPDEKEVLALVMNGSPSKAIAHQLDVSIRTIEARRASIFRKIGADSLAELIRIVVECQQRMPRNE